MNFSVVILAAGMGTRYGGLKQLDRYGPAGETITEYLAFDAIRAGFTQIVFVIRESMADEFEIQVGAKVRRKCPVKYVYQDIADLPSGFSLPAGRTKPWGTAHALWVCRHVLNGPFVVLNADDFYGASAFQSAYHFLRTRETPDTGCVLAYALEKTVPISGNVSRAYCDIDERGRLEMVREIPELYRAEGIIYQLDGSGARYQLLPETPVSMNFWGLQPSIFTHVGMEIADFLDNNIADDTVEIYLPDVVNQLIEKGVFEIKALQTADEWAGVTNPEDKITVSERIRMLIKAGVYPDKLWT